MQELKELTALIRKSALRAYTIGLQTGNGGNISARIGGLDRMLIKETGSSFGECGKKTLVLVDFDGTVLKGRTKPSREFLTHAAIYRLRGDVGGIVHCHAPWAIAAAAFADALPPVTHHMEMKLGDVPVLSVDAHADEEMAGATLRFLQGHPGIRAFIHRRHGLFGLGKTVTEAEHNAELVEECAKIAMLIKMGERGEE